MAQPLDLNPKNYANIDEYNDAAFATANNNLVPCENCGRTFKPESLQVHLRSCVSLNGQGGGGLKARAGKSQPPGPISPNIPTQQSQQQQQQYQVNKQPQSTARPTSASKRYASPSTVDSSNRYANPQYGASSVSLQQEPNPSSATNRPGSAKIRTAQTAKAFGPGSGSGGGFAVPTSGPVILSLVECTVCGRRFNADRIEKHISACKKVMKPRKKFDSSAIRARDTELEGFRPKTGMAGTQQRGTHASKSVAGKGKNWRRQHEEFIRAVREAKKVSQYIAAGGNLADLPPPPPSENPDYVQCPHCRRRFNETAASRHIPSCATTINKPKPPPHMRNPSPQRKAPEPQRTQQPEPLNRVRGSNSPSIRRDGQRADLKSDNYRSSGPGGRPASGPQATGFLPISNPGAGHRQPSVERKAPNQQPSPAPAGNAPSALAKFCHNCGLRYQSSNERFCCQCGCRRM